MNIDRRLERLTAVLRPVGCPACRWWLITETVICDESERCLRPETCRSCGRHVPIVDRFVVAGVDLDEL